MSSAPSPLDVPDLASTDTTAEAQPGQAESDVERLRRLLLQPERERLAGLARRLDDPAVRAAETGAVLVEAMRQAIARGPGLAATVAPLVEDAIHDSVRRKPDRLVDAIFPVIGPAIRRAITATLRDMVQSLNQVLESSMSWQGLKWRLEARRTGRPFAEIVLLHTLVYRVEQVFLVHRHTGLALQHVVAPAVPQPDTGVVAGMLTAIQDFVNESFNARAPGALERMQVGDVSVWIEPGRQAYLAAVVRGQAGAELSAALQDALAVIHREYAGLLDAFRGDAAPFAACRPLLEACLQARYAGASRPSVSRPLVVTLLLAGLLLALWGGWSFWQARRWDRLLARLRSEPGLVLLSTEREAGRRIIAGLRDPLAADPARLVAEAGYGADEIGFRWEPYQAAAPALVTARARAWLDPPPGTTVAFADGVLTLSGTAPKAWIDQQLRLAPLIPAVVEVRAADLRSQELVDAERAAAAIAQYRLCFPYGQATLPDAERRRLDDLAAEVRALVTAAQTAGLTAEIVVTGRTGDYRPGPAGARLAARRADAIVAALVARGLDRAWFTAVGAPPPDAPAETPEIAAAQLCADLAARVTPPPRLAGGAR